MPTIDLTTPPPAEPAGTLEALPRRIALTLPELRLLAAKAGDAPLPFELAEPAAGNPLESRLGRSRAAGDDQAWLDALATLHDPEDSLARRALLVDGVADQGVVGALGLLATPATAVDIDVVAGPVRARAWHRKRDTAVATLATADGVVFELAWFDAGHWPAELARVAVVPEDLPLEAGSVPDLMDLPYELLDAGAEAIRAGRTDLLSTIVGQHSGSTLDGRGTPVDDTVVVGLIGALVAETQGRLRVLVADVDGGGSVVGVLSGVLLSDGWRALHPHQAAGQRRVEVRRVGAADLAVELGPVLAEVTA